MLCQFQCLEQYLQHSITTGNVLRVSCPDASCRKRGKIAESEVKFAELNSEN